MALNLAGPGNVRRRITQTAGTVINRLVPPKLGMLTVVSSLVYNCSTTAHTLTILKPIGKTTFTAAGASGQAVVNVLANPGPTGDGTTGSAANNYYPQGVTANALAASDLVAIREQDGVTRLYTISSISSLAFTLTANLVAGVAAGDDLWHFGITTDTDPSTGDAHETILVVASTINKFGAADDPSFGVTASFRVDEPILIQSNNTTAAGEIVSCGEAYIPKVGVTTPGPTGRNYVP